MTNGEDYFSGAACPACHEQREHSLAELRRHHPFANHEGWTREELDAIAKKLNDAAARAKSS